MNAILKYPGGKWRISKWIISHFPEHKVYVEPYFGSGAVFFNKEPSYIETINDVDGNIVNLFKVCREYPDKLAQLIELTPFSREEFEDCYEIVVDDVIKNVDEAVRLRVYHDDQVTTYAKLSAATGKPEKDTVAFVSDELITREHVTNFKPGDISKFTVVMWVEGSDLECTDNILGGEFKVHLDFKSEFIDEENQK